MRYIFLRTSTQILCYTLRPKRNCTYNVVKLYSTKKYPTISELNMERINQLGIDSGYEPNAPDRSHLLKYIPKLEDLPPRNIKDSFLQAIIPLSTDFTMRNHYITYEGQVRRGRLMEDMDVFAVHCGYKYIYTPTIPKDVPSPYILVTANCYLIRIMEVKVKYNSDIRMSGFVSSVGNTSMELVVWLEQTENGGAWHTVSRALFVLVARNALGTKSVPINPIKPLNELEQKILKEEDSRRLRKKELHFKHIYNVVPTSEEQKLVHDLYIAYRRMKIKKFDPKKYPQGIMAMSGLRMASVIFSQPEDRNFYNTTFGGFIMKNALELSYVLCYQFLNDRPILTNISDIIFQKPLPINSIIGMKARIIYTFKNYTQIFVRVIDLNPNGENEETNSFHFTFKSPTAIPKQLYPTTYHEAMLYIDGKRQFDSVQENETIKSDAMDEYFLVLLKDS